MLNGTYSSNNSIMISNDNDQSAPDLQSLLCTNLHKENDAAMKRLLAETNTSYCPAYYDGALCWPPTQPGVLAQLPCPQSFAGQSYTVGENSTRYCLESGVWSTRTNYSQCQLKEPTGEPDLTAVLRIIFITGYSLSFGSLCIALLIFRCFKSLRCVRNTIHANLFAALLIRVTAWIVMYSYSELITFQKTSGSNIMLVISILNATASIQSFGTLAIFFWMFVEGFYLFLVVHYTYRAEQVTFRFYALIGWGIPAVLAIIRVIVDAVNSPLKLWVLESCDRYVVTIPALLMLGLNVLFLIAILYALNGKLRNRLIEGHRTSEPPVNAQQAQNDTNTDFRLSSTSSPRVSCPLTFSFTNTDLRGGQLPQQPTPPHYNHRQNSSKSTIPIKNGQINNRRSSIRTSLLSNTPRRSGLRDSVDLTGVRRVSSVRKVKQMRSLSDAAGTISGRSETERSTALASGSICLAQRPHRREMLDRLGSSLRLDTPTGARVRLWRLIGRINGREFAKTVKAGLMLMPLLGLPEIIFIMPYHPSLKPAFDLITAFLTSTQGFWVTLLYCFLTQEVQKQLEKRKHLLTIRSSIRRTQRWPPCLRQSKSDSLGVLSTRRQS